MGVFWGISDWWIINANSERALSTNGLKNPPSLSDFGFRWHSSMLLFARLVISILGRMPRCPTVFISEKSEDYDS